MKARWLGMLAACWGCTAEPTPLLLLAPDHMRPAVQRLVWEWSSMAATPTQVVYVDADEAAHLVDTGAAADVVVAPMAQMGALEGRGHLHPGTRSTVIGDHLAVVRLADVPGPRLRRASDLGSVAPVLLVDDDTTLGATTTALLGAVATQGVRVRSPQDLLPALQNEQATHAVMEVSRALDLPELHTALVLTEGAGQAALTYDVAVTNHAAQPEPALELAHHLASDLALAAFLRVGFVRATARGPAGRDARGGPPRQPARPAASPRQPAAK